MLRQLGASQRQQIACQEAEIHPAPVAQGAQRLEIGRLVACQPAQEGQLIVKWITNALLVDIGDGRLLLTRLQQRQPFEGDSAVVGAVDGKTLLDKLQCLRGIPAHHGDAGQPEEAAVAAVTAPGRLVEVIEGGIELPQTFLDVATQQARLATLGVLVEAMGTDQRLIDVGQRLLIVGAVVLQRCQRQVAAIVAAIQLQCPQVVIKGRTAGMQILLKMLADEVELVDRVEIDGGLRRGGRIRQGFACGLMLEIAQDRLALLIQQAYLQASLAGDGLRLKPGLTRLQI